jgi:hypothetical protein
MLFRSASASASAPLLVTARAPQRCAAGPRRRAGALLTRAACAPHAPLPPRRRAAAGGGAQTAVVASADGAAAAAAAAAPNPFSPHAFFKSLDVRARATAGATEAPHAVVQ